MHSKLIVLVGGCFDLLHYGHISFLTQAKTYGDHLMVLLEPDKKVHMLKGEGRPFHTQHQRQQMLLSLRVVDEVMLLPVLTKNIDYYNLIRDIAPSVIAFTEGDPILEHKIKQAEMIGTRAVVIPKVETHSTTKLAKLLELE